MYHCSCEEEEAVCIGQDEVWGTCEAVGSEYRQPPVLVHHDNSSGRWRLGCGEMAVHSPSCRKSTHQLPWAIQGMCSRPP